MNKSHVLAAALLACAFGAQASVTQLADESEMTTSFVNDFESAKNAGPITFDAGSQLFSASGAAHGQTSSGTNGLLSGGYSFASITATLAGAYTAVGLYFGNDDTCCASGVNATLSVYSGASFLGSVTVAGNMNDYADQFIGLSSTEGFDRVVLSYDSGNLYVFADDVRVGSAVAAVPEPETYALLLGGLGLVGWMARRRRA